MSNDLDELAAAGFFPKIGGGLAVVEGGTELPACRPILHYLVGEFLGLLDVPSIKGGAEEGRIQPFVAGIPDAGSLAGGKSDRGGDAGLVVVAFAFPRPVETGQVGRRVVIVEVQFHAGFVFDDGAAEVSRILAAAPFFLIPATEEATTLRGVTAGADKFEERSDGAIVIAGFGLCQGALLFYQGRVAKLVGQTTRRRISGRTSKGWTD